MEMSHEQKGVDDKVISNPMRAEEDRERSASEAHADALHGILMEETELFKHAPHFCKLAALVTSGWATFLNMGIALTYIIYNVVMLIRTAQTEHAFNALFTSCAVLVSWVANTRLNHYWLSFSSNMDLRYAFSERTVLRTIEVGFCADPFVRSDGKAKVTEALASAQMAFRCTSYVILPIQLVTIIVFVAAAASRSDYQVFFSGLAMVALEWGLVGILLAVYLFYADLLLLDTRSNEFVRDMQTGLSNPQLREISSAQVANWISTVPIQGKGEAAQIVRDNNINGREWARLSHADIQELLSVSVVDVWRLEERSEDLYGNVFGVQTTREFLAGYQTVKQTFMSGSEAWQAPFFCCLIASVFMFVFSLGVFLAEPSVNILFVALLFALLFLVPTTLTLRTNVACERIHETVMVEHPEVFMFYDGGRDALRDYVESNPIYFLIYGVAITKSMVVGFITGSLSTTAVAAAATYLDL